MAPRSPERQPICVARIGAPHGVRGEVKLWSFTAEPQSVAAYGPLQTADGRHVEIEALRPGKEFLVARLKGIADRNAAEALRNSELFVPRERLPEPQDADEFYHTDLIGLTAVDTSGAPLGTVIAVHNFGAGDLIELRRTQGGETVLLPFNAAAVPSVDVANGRIVVEAGAFLESIAPDAED